MILKNNKFTTFCIFISVMVMQIIMFEIVLAQETLNETVEGTVITSIEVSGNIRIEESTIKSYINLNVGDTYTDLTGDTALKRLYGTGLFADVDVGRRGTVLVVEVAENPIINRIVKEISLKTTKIYMKKFNYVLGSFFLVQKCGQMLLACSKFIAVVDDLLPLLNRRLFNWIKTG